MYFKSKVKDKQIFFPIIKILKNIFTNQFTGNYFFFLSPDPDL
jgi:hypothetical protein